MAQSALNVYSPQSIIVENNENVSVNPSKGQEDSNVKTYEYLEQSTVTMSVKEIFFFILFVRIGVLIEGFLTFYYSKRKIYTILEEERVYYLDYPPLKTEKSIFHYITLFHILKRRKDSYKRQNKDLKKEMNELELEIDRLKEKFTI